MTAIAPSDTFAPAPLPRTAISKTISGVGMDWPERLFDRLLWTPLEKLRYARTTQTGFRLVSTDLAPLREWAEAYFAASSWQQPCQDMFDHLVRAAPDALLNIIRSGALRPGLLTHAAETAGQIKDAAVVPLLIGLLEHDSPLVREGAVYGLRDHYGQPLVRTQLERLAANDPVEGVREAAAEALEDG